MFLSPFLSGNNEGMSSGEDLKKESTNEYINKWNNKSMFLSLSLSSLLSLSLKKLINRIWVKEDFSNLFIIADKELHLLLDDGTTKSDLRNVEANITSPTLAYRIL